MVEYVQYGGVRFGFDFTAAVHYPFSFICFGCFGLGGLPLSFSLSPGPGLQNFPCLGSPSSLGPWATTVTNLCTRFPFPVALRERRMVGPVA